jgi:hypothetical protein
MGASAPEASAEASVVSRSLDATDASSVLASVLKSAIATLLAEEEEAATPAKAEASAAP